MNPSTNVFKTVFLLSVLSAIFLFIGYALGGEGGLVTALVISLVMNFVSYWYSDKIVLAAHNAVELAPGDSVYEIVRELAAADNLPMPRVYSVPSPIPNAFATGRDPNHSAVAVMEGLVQILDKDEVRAVLAHEMSHIKNHDVLVSTVAATLAAAIMYLAHLAQWAGYFGGRRDDERGLNPVSLILVAVLAPIATTLVQMAVSRTREYMADDSGARLSHEPLELASALQKISDPALVESLRSRDPLPHMQPAFSHLYLVNQFSSDSLMRLFSTHPPIAERIARLRRMAGQA